MHRRFCICSLVSPENVTCKRVHTLAHVYVHKYIHVALTHIVKAQAFAGLFLFMTDVWWWIWICMNVVDFDHCTAVLNDDGSDKTVLMDTHAVEKCSLSWPILYSSSPHHEVTCDLWRGRMFQSAWNNLFIFSYLSRPWL